MDARSYHVEETLKNVLRVTVRAIRPDDRRSLYVVEQLVGILFVSILIARLAGVYLPRRRNAE
nr:hypothetical protein [Gammaproteobacteria bacterium]